MAATPATQQCPAYVDLLAFLMDRTQGVARAGGSIVFELDSLGWKAFQDVCAAILRESLGQTVQVYAGSRDGGRDATFVGTWNLQGAESISGAFAVQCKFRADRGSLSRADISTELPKIRRLAQAGLCDVYVLMTNASVTAVVEESISVEVRKHGPRTCVVLGREQLDQYLRDSPRLRALVPRVYGLGDLGEILDERAYTQALTLLRSLHEDLAKFVVTEPYTKSFTALTNHGFVLLLGPPAAGKTMIASALAMSALDIWKSRPVKVDAPDVFTRHWNPHDPGQFLWIDDAFGTTQYQSRLTDDWNRILPEVRAAVGAGTRIVMTSRDYIWQAARQDLKLASFQPLETSQVVIDVQSLGATDKAQILYNHLKFGDQSREFKRAVKPFLDAATLLPEFLPEVARRFGDTRFTQAITTARWSANATRSSVLDFFKHPVGHLMEVIGQLGVEERAALALVFMSGGRLGSPVVLTADQEEALDRLGASLAAATRGLDSLNGSLVTRIVTESGQGLWTFKHPTVADAFRRVVVGDPELLVIYLAGANAYQLLGEITCGDVGVQGALIVHSAYWGLVIRRITDMGTRTVLLERFLEDRCSDDFIREFQKAAGGTALLGLADRPRWRLAVRLLALGLLEESLRIGLVDRLTMMTHALDPTAFHKPACDLFRDDEWAAFLKGAREELIPDLGRRIGEREDEFDGSEGPDSWFSSASELIDALRDAFDQDAAVDALLDDAAGELFEAKERISEQYHDVDSDDVDYGGGAPTASTGIFSDVDA